MLEIDTTPRHPIRVVAKRTGLTPPTIRAWERRYGAVQPGRSEGGQRLYSDRDLERLITLRELTEMGRTISAVAALPPEAATALLLEDRTAATSAERPLTPGDSLASWTDEAFGRMLALDAQGLERLLWRAFMGLGAAAFLDGVAGPLLTRVGAGWEAGQVTPAQEHLGTGVIERVLAWVTDPSTASDDGPRMVVATLPGERHGLGARFVATTAAVEGWRVTYLGTDLPATDIAATAHSVGADAVAISAVSREVVQEATEALVVLRGLLDPRIDLLVGGRVARLIDPKRLPGGVTIVSGLEQIRGVALNGQPSRHPPRGNR